MDELQQQKFCGGLSHTCLTTSSSGNASITSAGDTSSIDTGSFTPDQARVREESTLCDFFSLTFFFVYFLLVLFGFFLRVGGARLQGHAWELSIHASLAPDIAIPLMFACCVADYLRFDSKDLPSNVAFCCLRCDEIQRRN